MEVAVVAEGTRFRTSAGRTPRTMEQIIHPGRPPRHGEWSARLWKGNRAATAICHHQYVPRRRATNAIRWQWDAVSQMTVQASDCIAPPGVRVRSYGDAVCVQRNDG